MAVPVTRRPPAIPNGVLGMIIFVAAECMFFAGMISAHTIAREGFVVWPPLGQPRLPVNETAFNTAALILSGLLLVIADRRFAANQKNGRVLFGLSIALGIFFVAFQGMEWMALIEDGLTLVSSSHGSFFYMIVGTHAVHVILALIAMIWVFFQFSRGDEGLRTRFKAVQVFWYFVVILWPILYVRVYM